MTERKEKFTPGPWGFAPRIQHGRRSGPRRVCGKSFCRIVDTNGNSVAYAYQQIPKKRQRSNATLIAKAPEMYVMLEEAYGTINDMAEDCYSAGNLEMEEIFREKAENIYKLLKEARGER